MSTTLPDKTGANSLTDAATTGGQQKTNLGNLRDFIADLFGTTTAALRTVWETFRLVRPSEVANLSFAFSVGSSALTIATKTRAGATPSATDPVLVGMRNATAGTGDFNLRAITAAQSLVISSGSTLGLAAGDSNYLYLYEIDNAGTLELAISQAWLGASGIVTTSAEGGAGAADAPATVYSTSARSAVPFRAVARLKAPQTVAGTWAAVPTECQLWPFDVPAQDAPIPVNSQSAAYTTRWSDRNGIILHPSADTTARVFTIDSNANVPYPVGTAITIINQNGAGTLTIAITSDTMRLAGAGTTGSRTLTANGLATAIKVTSTEWIISGTNLS